MSTTDSSSESLDPGAQPAAWGRLAPVVDRVGQWFGLGTILAALAAFTFEMPTSFSGSGYLTVHLSEPASVLLAGALVVAVLTARYKPSRWAKWMLAVLAAFLVWYLVTTLVRLGFGGNVKQSLLVMRTTLLPLVAYFVVDAGWDNRRRIISGMVLFNAAVVLFHLPEWHNLRMSSYLGNSIVFDTLIAVLVPLNVLVFSGRHRFGNRLLTALAGFNLLAALVLPIWTGSRSAAGTVAVAFVASVALVRPSRRVLLGILAVVVAAFALHFGAWLFNPQGVAYGVYRLVPTPGQVADATGLSYLSPFDTVDREAHSDVAAEEMVKSDQGRSELTRLALEEIRSQPIFGSGQVYFEIDSYRGRAQYSAHNFILDHLNAYGSPGFLIYLAFFAVLLAPKLRNSPLTGADPGVDNGLSLMTTAVLMGVSLTQPTMMIPVVITTYFVIVSALQHPDEQPGLRSALP